MANFPRNLWACRKRWIASVAAREDECAVVGWKWNGGESRQSDSVDGKSISLQLQLAY